MYCFNCAKMDTRVRTQHSINNASENFVNSSGPNRRLEGEMRASAWHGLTLRSCFWIKLMFVTWSNKSSFSHWRLFQCSFREGHGKKLAIEMHHLNIQGKKIIKASACVFLKRFLITVLPDHRWDDCSLFHHIVALELS